MNRIRFEVAYRLLLPSILMAAAATVQAAPDDAMADRVQACDACHARSVQSPEEEVYYPSISGKPVEYLYQQLLNFREGRRVNPTMKQMLAYLSPEYLHEIAAWYASQPAVKTGKVGARVELDAERAARGKFLVQQGEGAQPACAACHGGDLSGDGVAIPGLRGLSSDYLTAQLGAWQAGTRHAREPDCMAEVATALSGKDVEIVVQWIAGAQDEDLTATKVDTSKLPLECGAVQ